MHFHQEERIKHSLEWDARAANDASNLHFKAHLGARFVNTRKGVIAWPLKLLVFAYHTGTISLKMFFLRREEQTPADVLPQFRTLALASVAQPITVHCPR